MSFRRSHDDTPTLITIPSSNVLLEKSLSSNEASLSTSRYTTPSSAFYTTTAQYEQPSLREFSTAVTALEVHRTATNSCTTTTTTGHDPAVPQCRRFRGRIVKARDVHLPDHVLAFKRAREARTAMATWTGGLLGLVALGPLGAAIGASTAYSVAKTVGKAKERHLISQAELSSLLMPPPPAAVLAEPVVVARPVFVAPASSPTAVFV
jgi:hypothetical protein